MPPLTSKPGGTLDIVLYNYVQPSENGNPGGGVTVYLRNLSTTLRTMGHRVRVLSAGDRYNPLRTKPYLSRRSEDEFVIFNSPVVAPAIFSFHDPDVYLRNASLDHIPDALSKELPNVDVFHFHNIEGLTQGFLHSLKKKYPRSAFLYSAHNYNVACPQVYLWKNDRGNCVDYESGNACVNCVSKKYGRRRKMLVNAFKTPIKAIRQKDSRFVSAVYSMDKHLAKLMGGEARGRKQPFPIPDAGRHGHATSASDFIAYRQAGISLVNDYFDTTLAVSDRTKQILVSLGAKPERISVSYIGTRHMDRLQQVERKEPGKGNTHVGYIGYMREDKGFFFFLDAIESLPPDVASAMDVTIAAKFTDAAAVQRMRSMAPMFRSYRTFDGYIHADLERILEPVNLGIVPPLWEDNLPQVAIEFVTHGIPILTSAFGGAQEIAGNPGYVFDASRPENLRDKLCGFVRGDFESTRFWAGNLKLRSNDQHANEILRVYAEAMDRIPQPSDG
jgi:glycosyltransferase involved in cell wall biosynthesis